MFVSRNNKAVQKTLYFDCYSGISGDMTLGALIDAGTSLEDLNDLLGSLKLEGYKLEAEPVRRGGLAGTRALVKLDDSAPAARHLSDILELIDKSDLPRPVQKNSSAIFNRLAEAEAAVHGISVNKVHFHEVGAVDAIVDIVGTAAALYLLEINIIHCSPLPAGRGEVQSAHGRLPLPAPATLELIAMRRAPVKGTPVDFELVTPTGAAIVTTLADYFGPLPSFNLEKVGYGAGSLDPGYPNFLRLLLGTSDRPEPAYDQEAVIIDTNIDDQNPEHFGYLMERLFAAGALDAWYTPIQMKKNRPAVQLTVLSPPEIARQLQDLIFYETSTLGLRLTTVCKATRPRETFTVQSEWGPIRIKTVPAPKQGPDLHFAPEYEDCRKVARSSGLPLKEVYRLAGQLFQNRR